MATKGPANFPDQIGSGMVGNATAIALGMGVVYLNPTTDLEKVVRATADNQTNFAGIAYMASAGVDTALTYVIEGRVNAKISGVVTANDPLVLAANGCLKVAAAGNKNIVAIADGSGIDADMIPVRVGKLSGIPT